MANDDTTGSSSRDWLLGLALAGSVAFSAGCHGPLKPGMDALAEGNYEKAEKHARTGLAKRRNDPELSLLLADALVGEERYEEAEPYARKAAKSNDLGGRAFRTLGKVHWELDRPVEAVAAWRQAREKQPSLVPDDDYVRALERAITMAEGRAEVAAELQLRRELSELRPDHPEASEAQRIATRERLAETYVREGNYEAAVDVLEALSEDRPENAEYPFSRGRILASLGEDDRSIAAFDEYIAHGEGGKYSRVKKVAEKAESLGAFAVAVHFYDAAIHALPDRPSRKRARIHRRLAGLLLSAGVRDEGEANLRNFVADMTAVGGEPVSAEIFLSAASVATQNRHPDLALDLLERAITDAAPSWRATQNLAELYARRARANDVERVLRTYVDRADDATSAKLKVGGWAADRRNFELAKFFLEDAVNDEGDVNVEVWLQLARVYSALGYMDEVRRVLKTYTREHPDRRRALFEVANIYRTQRLYDEAEEALKSAAKENPDDLLVVKLLEELYREWNRPKKIHEVYERWAKARGNKASDLQLIGERFYRQQEWDAALPYLQRAAKEGENDAWLQVADIYARQRKERDMKAALDNYLANATDRPRALYAVLQRYRTSTWNYEAIPILEELIKLEPRNVVHYEQLSQLYFDQGRDVEAFELWKRFIANSDNPIASLETMARRFRQARHQEWMLQFLLQVLEREEDPDPRIYRLLGDTYSDIWSNNRRNIRPNVVDSIFTQENKAKEYYSLYLEKAKPGRGDLQSFAESMRQKQFWALSARAYEELAKQGPLQNHQTINYAIVLLNLGEAERAEAMFAGYFDDRNGSVDAALAISDQLFSARRYESVEPYLRTMLDNGDEALVRQAFMRLAEVYRNSDRIDEIKPLIADFLDRTQNPADARRNVQMMLEAAGMWEEAAEQLEQVAELQGEDAGFALGQNLYRAGKRDAADDAFRDYAADNVNPAEAWSQVAEFYETRGEVEKARNAFQNAANAAPQSEMIQAALGRYLILTGLVDEGRKAFERARANVPHGQRGSFYRTEVEALYNTGQFGAAREEAREAVGIAYLDRDYFYEVLATVELESGDPVRADRMVDELTTANLPLGTVVRILRRAGFLERAVELIDQEIANGDYILGGDVLLQNSGIFTTLGGVTRLMRSAQPLLERGNRDSRTPKQLGMILAQEGHLQQGAMLMRNALELGDTGIRPMLAQVYASLGHHEEAFEMLQAELANLDSLGRMSAIQRLGFRYEVLGERDRFRGLLEHLSRDPRFSKEAVPYLVQYLVEDGEVALVVDTVGRFMASSSSEVGVSAVDDQSLEVALAALTAGVEELAIGGFAREAQQLLETAPERLRQHEEVRDLRLRVAAFTTTGDVKAEFEQALASLDRTGDDSWQRLRIAELAFVSSRPEEAAAIAEPLVKSPDFGISSRAFRVLVRTAHANNDLDGIDRWVALYLDENADKMSARSTIHGELIQLGLDDRALAVAGKQATLVPTYSHVRDALTAAQRAGDVKGVKRWSQRLVEVDRQNPNVSLQHSLYTWTLRQDERLNAPVRDLLSGTWDNMLSGIQLQYIDLHRRGEAEQARQAMKDYLESTNLDPFAVQNTIQVLDQYKLHGEIARVVAPLVPDDQLTLTSRRLIGLANMSLGFDDAGLAALDRNVELASDSAHEATQIADELLVRNRYRTALRFAEMAVEKRPTRPAGKRVRGLARLAAGDLEGATEDIGIVLDAGLDRNLTLHQVSSIALRSGHIDFARRYLDELFVAHAEQSTGPSWVFGAFQLVDASAAGVQYVESRRPEFAAGEGIAGNSATPQLAQLYEDAGNSERSFEVYRESIRRLQFSSPFSEQLATFHNNLAYSYSTSNTNIDEGLVDVRRAIAQNPSRQASYIDTLGWLYYRAGDLEKAEQEIRRAIRSSDGTPGELVELYAHLAEIRAARGFHGESVWLQIFSDAVKSPVH